MIRKKMRKRKCANCGKEFSYNVILHRKYCSQRCYHKHKGNLNLRKFYVKKDFPSKEEFYDLMINGGFVRWNKLLRGKNKEGVKCA